VSNPGTLGDTAQAAPRRSASPAARRAAIAGGVGTLIEYYDFSVYGFLAVTIAPLFFPSGDPAAAMLATLAVFGSGYLVRPLGGVFFGWLGDRSGRRTALVATVLGMGVCSALLGLIPTYATAGLLAPVLLVAVRLAGGFMAGGEIGGAATYIAESAPPRRRGLFGSFTPMGSTSGFAVAAAVTGVVTGLTSGDQMASWGWRIPFLLCIPLALLSLYARVKLDDTPEFAAMTDQAEAVRNPLLGVVRERPVSVLRVIGLAIATNGSGYIGLTYMSVYLINDLKFDADAVYWLSALVIVLACLTMPVVGMLTDRFGRRPVLVAGLIGYVLLSYPLLAIMGTTSALVLVGAAYFVFMALNAVLQVPAFPMFTELFPRRIRYTGVALGFNIGTIIAGGTAPYIAAQLVHLTGNEQTPALWVIGVSAVGLLSLLGLRETSNQRLPV